MTQHDIEAIEREQHEHLVHRAGGDGAQLGPSASQAQAQIEEILRGHGDVHQLPQLLSFLDDTSRADYAKVFSRFESVPGDVALQCAEALSAPARAALTVAFRGKAKPPPAELRRYLADQFLFDVKAQSVAAIDADTVADLRAALPGSFITQLPTLTTRLDVFQSNAAMLRWFVEMTPPALCAMTFGAGMTTKMAATLDAHKLWGWVDAARPTDIGGPLAEVIPAIADGHARTRLESLASGRAGLKDNAFYDARDAQRSVLHDALKKPSTLEELMNAAGTSLSVDSKAWPKLVSEITRLHASADDIVSIAAISGTNVDMLLQLLLRSPGVTAAHVTWFMAKHGSLTMLADAKTRAAVRAAAPELDVHTLLSTDPSVHDLIINQPGLLAWFLETAQPKELRWLCASNVANAAKATRLVHSKIGFDWVRALPMQPEGDGKDIETRTLLVNCHDEATADYIRLHLLREWDYGDKVSTRESLPTNHDALGGAGGRLVDAVGDWGTSEEVVARLRDLDPAMRMKLGKDDVAVASIASAVASGDLFARAAKLMDVSFASTVAHCPAKSSIVVAYLDSRPHAEQQEAIGKPGLFEQAAESVHANLLLVFPALRDPKVLASALQRDSDLLGLLLAGSDPSEVMSLIGSEPARAAAAPILHAHPDLVKQLPRAKDMSDEGRQGVEEVEHATPEHSKEHRRLEHERTGDSSGDKDARAQGKRLGEARKSKTLVEAIETLGRQHERKEATFQEPHSAASSLDKAEETHIAETNALAILAEHKPEVPALLTDRTMHSTVKKLAESTDLPPNIAIPWIDPVELARMPNAVTWWMTYRDPSLLMHHLDNNKPAQLLVIGGLNTGTMGALAWLQKLPKGFELDTLEDRVIDQMRPLIRDSAALRELFHVRFGVPAPDYSAKEMNDLWTVIGRLPPNHVKQERISKIDVADLKGKASGQYSPGDHRIDLEATLELGKTKDAFYEEAREGFHTRAELKAMFAYDDARFDQLLAQGRFEMRQGVHEQEFRQKQQNVDLFTQVVLHEVGHSVDDILGSRTPPVFDFAGWHAFSDATFEEWASEMGGWDRVSNADKKQIREAWIEAARGQQPVKALVDPEHPAVAAKYATVGLVKAGREGETFAHARRAQIGDRVFVAGSYVDSWYSVKASAAQSAPSTYSLYAPAEYFAESYVEYYRAVDGSPGSQAKKGGALPGPVRQWFDENVDKLKYDPMRFKGGASDRGDDAPTQARSDAKDAKTKAT